jgi:hypothetical protein
VQRNRERGQELALALHSEVATGRGLTHATTVLESCRTRAAPALHCARICLVVSSASDAATVCNLTAISLRESSEM